MSVKMVIPTMPNKNGFYDDSHFRCMPPMSNANDIQISNSMPQQSWNISRDIDSTVDMVGSSAKSESTLLTSATREDIGVEVEVGICRSSSYMILPIESCLNRNLNDEAIRNSIDRLAGSMFVAGNRTDDDDYDDDDGDDEDGEEEEEDEEEEEEEGEELDVIINDNDDDPTRIDRPGDIISKRFSKLAGAFRARISRTNSGHHGSWLVETRRRCFNMCNWLPKMCSCLDGGSTITGGRSTARAGSYERLGSAPTIFEISSMMQRARRRIGHREDDVLDSERQEELRFYNDDQTWTAVVVEKNLRTIDLCELLKVKRNVSGIAWSIVETWPELGFERTLEDHEDILAVHREMEMFAPHHERKFYFRQDFLKYEFFINPKQFFPTDMVAFPHDEDRGTFSEVESALRNYLSREDVECPQVFSSVWMRDELSNTWRKTYMLLRERKLYTTKKTSGTFPKRPSENDQLNPLAHLSDYHIYRIPNAKRCYNAPFEWGACLRPRSNAEAEDTEGGEHGLKVIAFHSEKARACWLTAMRLAKYGKQLRENYRAFKNKQCEQSSGGSPKEQYSSYNVTNESVRSRVAMDFTGSVGRIVEDPKEAKDIAESEGIIWRRRWRPFSRTPSGCAMVRLHGLDGGIHVLQPWFHGGLKREIAAAIIRDHGSVDGVFLVRESKSNPGAYVLTYKYSDKVFHAQIQPVFDERRNCWLYTLDKGATKFYDLLQLIEFYQLNAGSLPTRLTHYVQNGVPAPIPRPEDGGASPSPPEANQRFTSKTVPSSGI